jgi:lipopolysaccharide transport system ATP-binding protein
LFVSHSTGAVKTLCDRAILLEHGMLLRDGAPDAVLDYYNALIAAQRADYEIRQAESIPGRTTTRSGTAEASVESVELIRENRAVRAIRSGDAVVVRIAVRVNAPLRELSAGVLLRDRLGNDVFGTNTFHHGATRNNLVAGERATIDFAFPRLALGVGSYSISAALHPGDRHTLANFDWWDRSLVFQVFPPDGPTSIGVCALDVRVSWHDRAEHEPVAIAADGASGPFIRISDAHSGKTE